MAELKTPLSFYADRGEISDADGNEICLDAWANEDEMVALVAAVNRDAQHVETVRKLTEQRDALLAACRLCVASWDMGRDRRATYEAYSVSANRAEDAVRAAIAKAEGAV